MNVTHFALNYLQYRTCIKATKCYCYNSDLLYFINVLYIEHLYIERSVHRFRTGQGHCNACHKKWGFTDNELCDCGEIQTMSHIVNSCPLTKFDGGLQMRLPSTD